MSQFRSTFSSEVADYSDTGFLSSREAVILPNSLSFQVIDGKLDLTVADTIISKEILEQVDVSNFVSLMEAMTTVCYPKPKKALLNILRPFG